MMQTRLLSHFTALFFLFSSTVSYAENKTQPEEAVWYSVEYILFENKPLSNQALEPWTKQPFQMPVDAIALDALSEAKAFSPLNINQQQLHAVNERLERLSSYTPIAHGGWLQPLKEKEKRHAIQIIHQADNIQIEGILTFHRGRYLHLDVDLQLSDMIPSAIEDDYLSNSIIQTSNLYRLTETRRIRTSETNYFDHPRFGVLTIVEKIDSPVATVSSTELIEEDTFEIDSLERQKPNLAVPLNDN
ncbi:MAG: CsiV family protein [Cycloclasticus sp.]